MSIFKTKSTIEDYEFVVQMGKNFFDEYGKDKEITKRWVKSVNKIYKELLKQNPKDDRFAGYRTNEIIEYSEKKLDL